MCCGTVCPSVLCCFYVVDMQRNTKGQGTLRSGRTFLTACCTLKAVLVRGVVPPTAAMRVFLEASLAVLSARRRFWGASVHILNLCVLFPDQWISVGFDRAGVSSGVWFGEREAELVGLQAHTVPSVRAP